MQRQQTLLISDLHLSPDRPAVTRAFLQFLEGKARRAAALYILGDLFEAWIGDDDPSQLAQQITSALKQLTESGTQLYVMSGNRDFLYGKRFQRLTGATLLPDHSIAKLGNTPTLLLHGDTLCTEDLDYQKFRKRIRHPLTRWLLTHLPLSRRQKIATDLRNKSQQANSNKPDNIMDVTPSAVEKAFADSNVKQMIHGHTHRPAVHKHKLGQRIVLGDWHHQGWYIAVENDSATLESFVID